MKMDSRRTALRSLVLALLLLGLLAIPAMASANVTLTNATTGNPLGLGETVEGASTDFTFEFSIGRLECAEAKFIAEVTADGGETAETESGNGTWTQCNAGAAPIVYTDVKIPAIVWFDDGTSLREMYFHYHIIVDSEGHFIDCELSGIVEGEWFKNTSEDEVLPSEITGGGDPGCPASATISGTFLLHQGADEVVFE